ncbi:MAG: DUF4160 domain-containing protein [Burkholderiaceae bacterium]|nr:DUF4160 domain-containing protein [Burkholderiaceae bacterium]
MPTIFRTREGWSVRIYLNDHRPPHVHVVSRESEARFGLLCDIGRVRLIENFGFSRAQLGSLAEQLSTHIELLCERWTDIHG